MKARPRKSQAAAGEGHSLFLEQLEPRILLDAGTGKLRLVTEMLGEDLAAVPDGQEDLNAPVDIAGSESTLALASLSTRSSDWVIGPTPAPARDAGSLGRSPSVGAVFVPHYDSVTDYDWWYGCSPTTGGMHAAWWDYEVQLIDPGYTVFPGDPSNWTFGIYPSSNPADYAVPDHANGVVNGWNHVSDGNTWQGHPPDSIGDFMLTVSGGSYDVPIEWGMQNFMAWDDLRTPENESWSVTTSRVYTPLGGHVGTWTFDDYKAEIDAGRPVHLWLSRPGGGHSVLAVGYYEGLGGDEEWVELYTTWNVGLEEWEWVNETQSGYGYTVNGGLLMDIANEPDINLTGYFALEHTYIIDLEVAIGLGSPASPTWETTVWSYGPNNVNLVQTEVDLSGAWPYLGTTGDWYLKVYDDGPANEGSIMDFQIRYQGQQWFTSDNGEPIVDLETHYAYVTRSFATSVDVDLQDTSDTGASDADNLTNINVPIYDVTVNGPGTINIDWDGDGLVDPEDIVADSVPGAGIYQYSPLSPLADGSYAVDVTFIDLAMVVSTDSDPTTIDTLGPTVNSVTPSGVVGSPVSQIDVTFSDANGLWDSTATDAANYALENSGGDATFGDGNETDLSGQIGTITYDGPSQTASLPISAALTDEAYQLTIIGSTSVRDLAGNPLNNGTDELATFTVHSLAPSVIVDLQASSDSGMSDSDDITSDTTPAYDVTVNEPGIIDVDWDGDLIVDETYVVGAGGTYQYTAPALVDGVYRVAVTFTDTASNVATDDDPTTIDTVGPTVSSVSPSGSVGSPASQIQVVFSDTNDLWTSTVTDSGNYELLASGGDGTFGEANDVDVSGRIGAISYTAGTKTATLPLSPALTDEAYRFTVLGTMTVRDAAGNALNDGADEVSSFTVDALAPSVIVDLQASSDSGLSDSDNITSDTTPAYDVTVNEPGTIEIDWDGDLSVDETYVVGAGGTYPYAPGSALTGGYYPVSVKFTDTAGNEATGDDPTTIDTQAPDVPDAPDLQAASDTGLSNTDNLTNDATPTLGLTGFADYYRLERDGQLISVPPILGDDGNVYKTEGSYTDDPLGDDDYSYVLYAVDAAGNVSAASGTLIVAIDTGDPAVPTAPDLQPGSDSGVADDDDITNVTSPIFDVVWTGGYFRFYRSGSQVSGNYESGTTHTAVSEPAGTWTYTVTAVDAAGNESGPSPGLQVQIDRTAPSAPGEPDLQAASDSGVSNSDNATNDSTPRLDLTGFADYYRLERDGGQISGDYGTSPTFTDSLAVDDTYAYVLFAVDGAGNVSDASQNLEVTLDTQAPDAPDAPDLQAASDTGVSNTDNLTYDPTPTLDLTGFGEYYRLEREGVQISSDYETTLTFTDGLLGDDTYAYVLYAVDGAGNVSDASQNLEVTLDTQAPDPPDAPDLQAASDTGVSNTDNLTNDATPTLGLTGFGEYYRLERDGEQISGNYETSLTFTDGSLGDDVYAYVLYAVDMAGNVSDASQNLEVTLDTQAPDPPDAPDLQAASDSGISASDNVTNDMTPTLELTGFDAYYRLERDGGQISADYAVESPFSDGPLADDEYSYVLRAVDAAGNVSEGSPALDVTIDTTPPDVPDPPDLQAVSDTGVSNTDNLTNDATPTLGLSGFGEYYRLERDGGQISGDYGTSPTFTDSLSVDDTYTYVVYAVDAAGNVSDGSDPLEVELDTGAPDPPDAPDLQAASDTGVPDNNVTGDRTPAFDVNVLAGFHFRLYRDAELVSQAPILGDDGAIYREGTSEELPEQPLGVHWYTATLVDAAGNESDPSDPLEVQITHVWPVGYHQYGDGVLITFYDVDPSDGVTVPDIAWSRGEYQRGVTDALINPGRIGDRIIRSITLFGDGGETADLGIAVQGNVGLLSLVDRRTVVQPLGFLVSEGYVRGVNLKGGITGHDLNEFTTEGGWTLDQDGDQDLDNDGDTDDLTGIYTEGYLRSVTARGDVKGDVVVDGDLNFLRVIGGDLTGDVILTGSKIGKVFVKNGDITGDIEAGGDIGRVTAIGGDITGSIVSEQGRISRVLAKAVYSGWSWTGGSIGGGSPDRIISAADYVRSVQALRGDGISTSISAGTWIGLIKSLGGDIDLTEGRSIEAGGTIKNILAIDGDILGDGADVYINNGNLGRLRAIRGAIDSVYADVDGSPSTRTGRIGSVKATGAGGIADSIIEAEGRIGSLWSAGSISGEFTASDGLGRVYAKGDLNAVVNVTGNLGKVNVRGDVLSSSIDVTAGKFGSLSAGGGVYDTEITVDGYFGGLYANGDLYNSTVHTQTLRRVVVVGRIWQESGGEIHAYTGRFFAKDYDERDTVDGSNDLWFDHHGPNSLHAWVG